MHVTPRCHGTIGCFGTEGVFFGLTSVATSVALSLIVAELSWRLFESPINRLKRHFT